MSKSVPNSPRNQHELMKSNTLPPTAILDTSNGNGNKNVSASPSRRSRGASLTNFFKKLSPKLRQNSNSPMKLLKERHPSTSDASVEEEPIEVVEEIVIAASADGKFASSDTHSKASCSKEGISEPTCSSHVGLQLITQAGGSGSSSPSEGNLGGGRSVRRTQQPPKTLNILNKIVVHPPPLEMERVKNKIASVESIGSCSLDADGTGSESSVAIDGRASSVSQRTLRSTSGGATSLTPKASLKETDEESVTTTERRTSNKQASKLYIPNGHGVSGNIYDDECQIDGERKKPSYIGISCSVSGYSNYSCYDSKVRKEGLRSRDNSPARLAFNNHGEHQQRTVDIEIDEMNGGVTYSSCEVHKSEATVIINGNSEMKKVTTFTMWRASSEDGILNGSGGSNSNGSASNHSYKETITKSSQQLNSKDVLTISTTPTKSLIQQRIERLYGPGALAQGFRKHAEIKNKNNEQLSVAKTKVIPLSSHNGEVAKTNGTTNHSNVNNISQPNVINPQAKNGQSFIDAMNKEKDRISRMINKSEVYLDNEDLPEEANGVIRAAIGKANLLISRKFRQFQGLCEKNLTQLPDEPFPTTVEDLTGFWDMVLIQVDDINRAFEVIEKANESGWKNDEIDTSYRTKDSNGGKKVRKVKTNTAKSENESAISKSRAEARRKLMELKSKGRQQKTGIDSTNGIEIYVADERGKC